MMTTKNPSDFMIESHGRQRCRRHWRRRVKTGWATDLQRKFEPWERWWMRRNPQQTSREVSMVSMWLIMVHNGWWWWWWWWWWWFHMVTWWFHRVTQWLKNGSQFFYPHVISKSSGFPANCSINPMTTTSERRGSSSNNQGSSSSRTAQVAIWPTIFFYDSIQACHETMLSRSQRQVHIISYSRPFIYIYIYVPSFFASRI